MHLQPNLRKAAVLLTSLAPEDAATLLKKLKPKQVEAVSIEIARLGALGSDEQESIITEFAESNPNALGGEAGGLDLAQALLEKALGKNARETLDNVRQSLDASQVQARENGSGSQHQSGRGTADDQCRFGVT